MTRCPSTEQLQAFLAEGLSGAQAEELEGHVQTCSACQQELERLTAGRPGQADPQRTGRFGGTGHAAAPALPVVPALPGYEILGELGRGGMGVVYKARQIQLDRVVALKVIRGEHLGNPEAVRRFCREMQVAARLAHPNLVTVFDAGQAGDIPFFTMEYLEGTDLARLVREHGPLEVARACDCVRQAALGLQHALERGLIHRDVKPANLLLGADGVTVKVLDLGLARLLQQEQAQPGSGLTEPGAVLGTLDFAAPEQLVDARSADTRADVYSLGGTLYYLLTSQVPFPEGSVAEKIARHLSDDPPPVERLRPEVPPAVAAVVRKLLAKRPRDRYQTPGELAAVLAALAGSGRPRRRWLLAALLVSSIVVLLGLVVWLKGSWGTRPADPTRTEEPRPAEPPPLPRRRKGPEQAAAALVRLGGEIRRDEEKPDRPVVEVNLAGSRATEADLIHLEALTQLQELALPKATGDRGLAPIRGLRRLHKLVLANTKVGNAGLAHLRGLTGLDVLILTETPVGDAGLEHLGGLSELVFLRLDRTKVSDAGLKHLKRLRQLETLDLHYTGVTGPGLADLAGLAALGSLGLDHTPVGDAGLRHLEGWTQLRALYLRHTKVSDKGLAHLKRLTELRLLDLSETAIGDKGMESLKDLTQLERLFLARTQIGDAGLAHLQRLTQLTDLALTDTLVTDQGLKHLAGLTKLTRVYLDGTLIRDAGLEHLHKLTSLEMVGLQRTKVTSAGVKALQTALPRVQVLR
jgi:serine/threonine protein kinase